MVKRGALLDQLRSQKLKDALLDITLRTVKDAQDRVLGDGSKIKAKLRSILKNLESKPKNAFLRWRLYVENVKKGKLLDQSKVQRLKSTLEGISRRTVKDAFERNIGDGSKLKGVLKSLIKRLEGAPKLALQQWRKYVAFVKKGQLLDQVRTQKLRIALSSLPLRVIRDAHQRVLGGGDKLKGALRSIIHSLEQAPKSAFLKWRKYVEEVKKGQLLDLTRTFKLKNALLKVPLRVIKDSFERLVGDGSRIKGALRSLGKKLEERPKAAFQKWRAFVEAIKQGKLITAVKAQNLR